MDKSWIKLPHNSPTYLTGLNTFLDFAFSHASCNDDNFTTEVQDAELVFLRNDAAHEFFSLMDEADRPLHQGCQKYSKLSFLIKLYHIKCLYEITNKEMAMML
ncbi:hypothetical protein K1719_000666 [Acacia pycnantha]|nr:hypothetical protein K1719_000666 [Acacia pycnantha]